MNYLEEMEQKLRAEHLERGHVFNHTDTEDAWQWWQDSVIQFVREAVLQSYRNGLAASRSGKRGGDKSALAAGKLKPAKPAQ